MQSLLEQLKNSVSEALVVAFGAELADSDPLVVPASNPKFGDYQSNVALSLPKKLKMAPRTIAEKIVENLTVENFCEIPTIAGPGFINFAIKASYLATQLGNIQAGRSPGY